MKKEFRIPVFTATFSDGSKWRISGLCLVGKLKAQWKKWFLEQDGKVITEEEAEAWALEELNDWDDDSETWFSGLSWDEVKSFAVYVPRSRKPKADLWLECEVERAQ